MLNFPVPAWTLDRHESDEELVGAHCAGDPDAFVILMSRHRHRIHSVATRMVGVNDRLDVAQESAVRIWRSLHTFRGECSLATWVHRITVNVCLDRLRATPPVDPHEDTIDWADPADDYVAIDLRHSIAGALKRLPPDQRQAIELVDLRGWTVAQAADALACPVGTVKSRCARGRAKLATWLSEPMP